MNQNTLKLKRRDGKAEPYDSYSLEVVEEDALGRPKVLRVIHDDDKVTVRDGMRFVTGYLARSGMRDSNPRA